MHAAQVLWDRLLGPLGGIPLFKGLGLRAGGAQQPGLLSRLVIPLSIPPWGEEALIRTAFQSEPEPLADLCIACVWLASSSLSF